MSVVEVKHFAKSFGNKVVHKDISFELNEGECLGLLGGSGAGKSVILRSLIGLEKPDSGSINVLGKAIESWSEKQLVEIRKQVAYVFQNGALFDSLSVFENLAYPLREHTRLNEFEIREKALSSLEKFGLSGSEAILPSQLSGGMQKRVGLLRSIILDPKVVLYDEPTAGLDPFNTVKIQEVIIKLRKQGVSSIFVTHDMPSAFAVCDRIAFLADGKIHSVGEMEKIKKGEYPEIQKFIHGQIQ